jgi:hypothetical protein
MGLTFCMLCSICASDVLRRFAGCSSSAIVSLRVGYTYLAKGPELA